MDFWLELGKICKNNDHKCLFHCITLAESLSRCWNTWSNGLIFKQLPWDPANKNAIKMLDPYIIARCILEDGTVPLLQGLL